MKLVERIEAMVQLGRYLDENNSDWKDVKLKAFQNNAWFTSDFVDLATNNITKNFLEKNKLQEWVNHYFLDDNIIPVNVGIVMAGNIPMVGFHDMLCVFISGHKQTIRMSSKDNVLLKHIVEFLMQKFPEITGYITFADMLKGCDAYIATGATNTARYFQQYFGKYPNIIRSNRTSVAVLTGTETEKELELLADDIHTYFGLGCRNVTKLYFPINYDFLPLLTACKKYAYMQDHPKYKNNYDYYLALQIMNNRYYMTNGNVILTEDEQPFSAISTLHYSYYKDRTELMQEISSNNNIQCIIGSGSTGFGQAQIPALDTYADGVDTLQFLLAL